MPSVKDELAQRVLESRNSFHLAVIEKLASNVVASDARISELSLTHSAANTLEIGALLCECAQFLTALEENFKVRSNFSLNRVWSRESGWEGGKGHTPQEPRQHFCCVIFSFTCFLFAFAFQSFVEMTYLVSVLPSTVTHTVHNLSRTQTHCSVWNNTHVVFVHTSTISLKLLV